MKRKRYTRRKFGALAVVGAVGLSGCLDDDDDPDDELVDDVDDEPDDEPADEPDDEVDDEPDDEADDEVDDEPDDEADNEVDDDPEEEYDFDDQPEDAAVMFETPTDGDTVDSPVEMAATVEGIDLEPAGTMEVGTGHLHILVDHECFEAGEVIPGPSESAEEDGIFHWSDGQSEDELELEPGEYDLCVQIGDGAHRAFGETDEITITVEEAEE